MSRVTVASAMTNCRATVVQPNLICACVDLEALDISLDMWKCPFSQMKQEQLTSMIGFDKPKKHLASLP